MSKIRLALLGTPLIWLDDTPLTSLVSTKARALLFYLAVAGQQYSREHLVNLLWTDFTEDRARNNLRVELTKLRSLKEHLLVHRDALVFNRDTSYELDVEQFENLARGPQRTVDQLTAAAELYRGEFLDDFSLRDAPEFERWVISQRTRFRDMALQLLPQLATFHQQRNQFDQAISYYRQLLVIDDFQELAHRELMRCLALTGRRKEALKQYEQCRQILQAELGEDPSHQTLQLYQEILNGQVVSTESAPLPPVRPSPTPLKPPLAIPFQAQRHQPYFVGREAEITQLRTLLTQETGNKFVALIGMGGLGKTTLATYMAYLLRDQFVDGVLWANAGTSDPLSIMENWGQSYGYDLTRYPDKESRSAALRGILADKNVLIILDDVLSPARIRLLLPNSDRAAVLLTTRNLEIAYALHAQPILLDQLSPENGLQLLVRIVGENRILAEQGAAARICQLLQNLPLAIEIAGQYLAARPRQRLSLLAERLTSVQARLDLSISDQAVRTSFTISWETLDSRLQRTFTLLGLFEGRSFNVPALANLANLDPFTAEDHLFSLTVRSLVSDIGNNRYQQHALLTDFAQEKLGNTPELYLRLADYYLHFAQEHRLKNNLLQLEWENLMGGMGISYHHQAWQTVLTYSQTLTESWFSRARYSDARQGYQWATAAAQALMDRSQLTFCLLRWGQVCLEQNEYAESQAHLQSCLAIYEEQGDSAGIADVLYELARIALDQSHYQQAEQLLHRCLQIRHQLGDQSGYAAILHRQARLAYNRGHYQQAEQLCRQAIPLQQHDPNPKSYLRTLRTLIQATFSQRKFDDAYQLGQQALQLAEQLNDEGESASVLLSLVRVHLQQKNYSLAQDYAQKSLTLFQQMGDQQSLAVTLYELSLIYEQTRDYPNALKTCLQSIQIFRRFQKPYNIANNLIHLGDLHQQMRQFEFAQQKWQEAFSIAQELNHTFLIQQIQKRLPVLATP